MVGVNGWPIPTTGGDWMRGVEKRIMHDQRKSTIHNASDLLGPSFGPFAVETIDWNSAESAFNGFSFSQPGALHSPDTVKWWIGETTATNDGFGIQKVWNYRDNPDGVPMEKWERTFYSALAGARVYSDWMPVLGGGGSSDVDRADLTGSPGEDWSNGYHKITGVGTPSSYYDAANKGYIDAQINAVPMPQIQHGITYIDVPDSSSAYNYIYFSPAFSSVPSVTVTTGSNVFLGANYGVTTTSFRCYARRVVGSAATNNLEVHWIAVGG